MHRLTRLRARTSTRCASTNRARPPAARIELPFKPASTDSAVCILQLQIHQMDCTRTLYFSDYLIVIIYEVSKNVVRCLYSVSVLQYRCPQKIYITDYLKHSDAKRPHSVHCILCGCECHSCGSERQHHWTMGILNLHYDTREWYYIADVTLTYK